MILSIYYLQDEGRLIIKTDKKVKYTYYNIPNNLFIVIKNLFERKFEGKIWSLLRDKKYTKSYYGQEV